MHDYVLQQTAAATTSYHDVHCIHGHYQELLPRKHYHYILLHYGSCIIQLSMYAKAKAILSLLWGFRRSACDYEWRAVARQVRAGGVPTFQLASMLASPEFGASVSTPNASTFGSRMWQIPSNVLRLDHLRYPT